MTSKDSVLITASSSPASDSWGFVGVVSIGDIEAYRTVRAYTTPGEALRTVQGLLAKVLGVLMAGQEWRMAEEEFGHAPLRTDLQFGLKVQREAPPEADHAGPH